MAKKSILTATPSAADKLRQLLNPRHSLPDRTGPQNDIARRGFLAYIVAAGPNAEADFADHRYWVKKSKIANAINENAGVTEAIELTAITDPANSEEELWISATHLGETSDESHDLATDGTQQVFVQWSYDAPGPGIDGGQIRFFFWVRPPQTVMPIGGEFFSAGSRRATSFVVDAGTRWSTEWQSEIPDPGGTLQDWIVYDGTLYACGSFDLYAGSNEKIIFWDGTKWDALSGSGLDPVYCFEVFGGLLYIGGFAVSGDNVKTYNGSSFSDATGAKGIGNTVLTLYDWDGTLVAGGISTPSDGYNGIQMLSGSSWAAMGSGFLDGVNPGTIYALGSYGTDLIAGGEFDDADGISTDNIASWDGSWSAIGGGTSIVVLCVQEFGDYLYIGGVYGFLKRLIGGSWVDCGDELAAYLDSGNTALWSMCLHPNGEEMIVGGKFAVRDDYVYGQLPCLCVSRFRELTHTVWTSTTPYEVGAVVAPTAGGLVYHICIDAGTSGSSEPSWSGLDATTTDGTVLWLAVEAFNHHDYYGGLAGNNTTISPIQSGASCFTARAMTLPGADEPSLAFCGNFLIANHVYSRLVANLGLNDFRAAGRGLRLAGTYGGIVRVAVRVGNGIVLAGQFDAALNVFGKGDSYLLGVTNVVLLSRGAFYDYGGRSEMQWGGCVFGDAVYLCGETSTAPVARKDNPPTWQGNTPYVEGEVVVPTTPNGFQYRCIVAGTSHATIEPLWPPTITNTVADNNGSGPLEWECEATGWTPVGVNITGGDRHTLASFAGKLWVGGTSIFIGSGYSYATSNGEKNAAGNWTGGNITDVIGIRKFTVGDYGAGERLIAACANITTGAVQVSSGGSFSELGGVGNRVTGECNDVVVWTDVNGAKHVMVVGSIQVNGTDCNAADYFSGTWSIILGTADLLGQVTALGNWVRDRYAVFAGGDFTSIDGLFASNFIGYRIGDEFAEADAGGTSAGARRIGPTVTFG